MSKAVRIPYPQPIPFPRTHRCAHPVLHSLAVLGAVVGWLTFSISTRGIWGFKLAAYVDPGKTGLGLPVAVLTSLAWLVLIPVGALVLYMIGMWRCTGALSRPMQAVIAEALQEPGVPGQPVMIERAMLTEEEAARRGLPGPIIFERIRYR